MNERIKELLEQATMDTLYETQNAVDLLDNPVTKQQRQLQLEKFAELIVRECARSVTWYTKSELAGVNRGQVFRANETVLQHFGVEE